MGERERVVQRGRGRRVDGFGFVTRAAAADADGGGVGGVGFADLEGAGGHYSVAAVVVYGYDGAVV